jgi:hypothetical protein
MGDALGLVVHCTSSYASMEDELSLFYIYDVADGTTKRKNLGTKLCRLGMSAYLNAYTGADTSMA